MRYVMKMKIAPSLMCADMLNLKKDIEIFEKTEIDYLHIDIMDGKFVPNYTLGTDICKKLKRNTDIPIDVHLMIENPESKLDWFEFGENDIVSIHYESTVHVQRTLAGIKKRGAKAFLALNPATPICSVENVLDDIDGVLVMTVNPGYAGQKIIPATIEKARRLREYLDKNGCNDIEIEADGNVSFENAKLLGEVGVNIFVAGSASIFNSSLRIEEGIEKFKSVINEFENQ